LFRLNEEGGSALFIEKYVCVLERTTPVLSIARTWVRTGPRFALRASIRTHDSSESGPRI
jgi:hypothetical protein